MEQYVILTVGKELFGLKIYAIDEIIKMKPIVEIPNSHAFIEGVINLRGRIVPVVSLSKRIGNGVYTATKQTRIVVAEFNGEKIGLIVDKVSKVTSLQSIDEVSEVSGNNHKSLFEGVAHSEIGIVSILNMEEVLKYGGE